MDKNNKDGNIWRKKVKNKGKIRFFKEAEEAGVKVVHVIKTEEGETGEEAEMQGQETGRVWRPKVWILIPILPFLGPSAAHFSLSAFHVGGREIKHLHEQLHTAAVRPTHAQDGENSKWFQGLL